MGAGSRTILSFRQDTSLLLLLFTFLFVIFVAEGFAILFVELISSLSIFDLRLTALYEFNVKPVTGFFCLGEERILEIPLKPWVYV